MKVKYQLHNELEFFIQKWYGEWSTAYHAKYVDEVLADPKMNEVKKVLSDMRSVEVGNAMMDIDTIIQQRSKIAHLNYLHVLLVSEPMSTAITHLYTDKLAASGFKYKYCSTVERAIDLLGLNIRVNELEVLIANLSDEF